MASHVQLNPETVKDYHAAVAQARRGDFVSAIRIAQNALMRGDDRPTILALLGMLSCQSDDLSSGIAYLTEAHEIQPTDVAVTVNLATAYIQSGKLNDALSVCTAECAAEDPSFRIWRLRGYIQQTNEDFDGAVISYGKVVRANDGDFESWNNLGNAYAALNDHENAISSLKKAIDLDPRATPARLNLANAFAGADRADDALAVLQKCTLDFPDDPKPFVELSGLHKILGRNEEALAAIETAAKNDPNNADTHIKLALEYQAIWRTKDTENAFRRAIALDPLNGEAYVLSAVHFDHSNQPEKLAALVQEMADINLDVGSKKFVEALLCRREKRFEDGLAALDLVGDEIEPVRCAQMRGQFNDRLGNYKNAFAAFTDMNIRMAQDPSDTASRAAEYRAAQKRDQETVTETYFSNWHHHDVDDGYRTPAFLVGFPRSGTTLLDTMLMGHPDVQLLEERPALACVEREVGSIERLPNLDGKELANLRKIYFEEATKWVDLRPDALLVDKFPLHLNKVPIIHRLFPDANFILALRHPCDVALSCYITNFRLNNAMVNFLDLESVAAVYDSSFGFWHKCRNLMPLNCHEVRYENMVANSEAELRPLFEYLGLDWVADVLNHEKTAADRGIITTASYSQVTEPIYNRANGRWLHYRDRLQPIIPVLKPWVDRFGYSIEPSTE